MGIAFIIVLLAGAGIVLFMQTPKFGKHPSGQRLARIQQSPHYKNGAFQNLSPTPMLTEGVSYGSMLKNFLFKKVKEPQSNLPTQKTDLLHLSSSENILVWLGHSSYFMQIDGKTILVDPVMSGAASPLPFTTRAFKGSDVYTTNDLPAIDYLFVTHDHWDHMDYRTLLALKPKVKQVICALGNGAHFERWGFSASTILEEDWNRSLPLNDGFTVHVTPARHFSGRGLKRNQALWASFVLHTPSHKIFLGGDSGYDTHFAEIGTKFGPFDLAILENGQYDAAWRYIHMQPHEVLKAAADLNAQTLLPVHSGKFTLGNHDWDEPLTKITALPAPQQLRIITPMIGEPVNLNDSTQQFSAWWKTVE